MQMGVDAIEMDVHMLRDGEIIAIHDADVRRTTDGKGRISELTLTEIKALDAGSWFNRAFPKKARQEFVGLKVPTLQEIIDLTKESSVKLYIEIKNPEFYPPDLESSLLSLIRDNQMEKRTRFLSFSPDSIRKIKALDPSAQTALLISESDQDPVAATLRTSADELGIRHQLVTPATMDAAHENGLSVAVWTVDQKADMRRMIRLGADSITTNHPDRLMDLLKDAHS